MRTVFALSALILLLTQTMSVMAAETYVAGERGALAQAIAHAQAGDILHLADVRYDGPITISKPLSLVGKRATRIVGTGQGSVVTIDASNVSVSGIGVEGSGIRLSELDSAITVTQASENVLISGNRITGNLIGINVHGARNAIVRDNVIIGRDDLRKNERGPGVYVWNAPGLLVEGNDISKGRDGVFITTSHHAVYRNNRFSDLRFALHSMYANDIEVTQNVSRGNDMGFAFMYSSRLRVTDNRSDGDRTHGFFMNFANYSKIAHNEVRNGGEKCLFVYNSNKNELTGNLFEGCGIGIHFTAGSEGNTIAANAFLSNRTQVKYVGTRWLEWSRAGQGNYWSDHTAFDINGDGIADSVYRPNDLIDRITWTQPMAKLLMGSPAVQLIRWSQSRFPGFLPGGIIDSHPLMRPAGAGARVGLRVSEGQQS